MKAQTVAGVVIASVGLGIGGGYLWLQVTPSWPLVTLVLALVGLGAYLTDPVDLGPLVQKALSRWTGGGNAG